MAKNNPTQFMRQVKQEVSKVTWPEKKEAWLSTVMVVVLTFLAAMFFFFVDMGIGKAIKFILGLGG